MLPLIAPPSTPPNLLRLDLAFLRSARMRSTSPSSSASSFDRLRTFTPWSLPFWSIKWNCRSILSSERCDRASSITRSEPFLMRNSSNWRPCETSVINCKASSERCLDLVNLPPFLCSFFRKSFVNHRHNLVEQLTVDIPSAEIDKGGHSPY